MSGVLVGLRVVVVVPVAPTDISVPLGLVLVVVPVAGVEAPGSAGLAAAGAPVVAAPVLIVPGAVPGVCAKAGSAHAAAAMRRILRITLSYVVQVYEHKR
ncbi:hypothetical protein [Sphingomonas sp.]|uniref:hypothetical protein n=1 Tax=Sphingomonas sp. TaxID=28214 RepID=UPI003B3A50B3